jgi:hypothetical protein
MLHVIRESGGAMMTDVLMNLRTVAAPLAEMLPLGPDGDTLALLGLATCCAISTSCCSTQCRLRLCLADVSDLDIRYDVLCDDGALQNRDTGHQAQCSEYHGPRARRCLIDARCNSLA